MTPCAVAFESRKPFQAVELKLEGSKAGKDLVEIIFAGGY